MYAEYFTYINKYPNYYYSIDTNNSYPSIIKEISVNEKQDDMLLYTTNFVSLELNYIIKWEYNLKYNIYFIYSIYKAVSGRNFSTISNLLDYDIYDNALNKTEIFSDKSFLIKIDFLLFD